jgi:hypothetical protein
LANRRRGGSNTAGEQQCHEHQFAESESSHPEISSS